MGTQKVLASGCFCVYGVLAISDKLTSLKAQKVYNSPTSLEISLCFGKSLRELRKTEEGGEVSSWDSYFSAVLKHLCLFLGIWFSLSCLTGAGACVT